MVSQTQHKMVEQSIYKVRFYSTQLLLNNESYVKGQREIVCLSDSVLEKHRAASREEGREGEGTGSSVYILGFTMTSLYANGVYLLFLYLPSPRSVWISAGWRPCLFSTVKIDIFKSRADGEITHFAAVYDSGIACPFCCVQMFYL